MKSCIHCGRDVAENFCAHCGQPVAVPRLTLLSVIQDFQERFLGVDGRFIQTITHLFKKPERVINRYIRGDRRSYLGPVAIFVIGITLHLLALEFFDLSLTDVGFDTTAQISTSDTTTELELFSLFNEVYRSYFKAVSFFGLIFLILAIWVLNSRRPFNFTEIAVFGLYYNGITATIQAITVPLIFIDKAYYAAGMIAFSMLYFVWMYISFLPLKHTLLSVAKALLVLFVYYFLVSLVVTMATAWYIISNKEQLGWG